MLAADQAALYGIDLERGRVEKNAKIGAALNRTRERRKFQICKSYELKIDASHLSRATRDQLKRLFVEARWFYNDLIARGDIPHADYKLKQVFVKNASGKLETGELRLLSAQMRQEIVDRAKDNIRALSVLKDRGKTVGSLKFKSRVTSIPLKQHGKTHRLFGKYAKIQNIGQPLKLMGLEQIPRGAELSSAALQLRHDDFFLRISTFLQRTFTPCPSEAIGIDFGIEKQLTLSNSVQIWESVFENRKIRRLQKDLSRRIPHSRNWRKSLDRLRGEYEHIGSKRRDVRNKIVTKIVSTYETVVIQDDRIGGWQKLWGRRVRGSAIGGIMRALGERAHTSIEVPRNAPTSMRCSRCGEMRRVALGERIYRCAHCGYEANRDLNAALNILKEGVPAECRELTPVDMKTATEMVEYFRSIPAVSASLVEEAGSPRIS